MKRTKKVIASLIIMSSFMMVLSLNIDARRQEGVVVWTDGSRQLWGANDWWSNGYAEYFRAESDTNDGRYTTSEAWGRTGANYQYGVASYSATKTSNVTTSTYNNGGFLGAKSKHSTVTNNRVDGWIERAGAWW